MSQVRMIALALVAAVWPVSTFANPYSNLQKAATKFSALPSFHAEMHFTNGKAIAVDFVGTDRARVVLSGGVTEVIAGSSIWINRNGSWQQLPPMAAGPILAMVEQYRRSPLLSVDPSSVKDLGMQTVEGKSLHAYSYVGTGVGGTPATVWLDANDLPMQVVTTSGKNGATITYSYGNFTIEPPH
jgi:outer membrane lipoprotein-sorting protein